MTTKKNNLGIGVSLPRKEDRRFLLGHGLYVADVHVPGILDIAFLRSSNAHGRLRGVEIPEGEGDRVFTAGNLTRLKPIRVESSIPGFKPADHYALATNKVRFAGECIAACLGNNRAEAEDLGDATFANIDELPALSEPLTARNDTLSLVHDEWGDNIYVQHDFEGGDIDSVRDAPVVVTRDYRMNRQSVSPLEPRAVLAYWD